MVCKAKTSRGAPCKAQAMAGGRVCRVHGGSAPQVIAAARHRLLMACDPVAARLIEIAKSKKTETKDAIVACREILNRAGVGAQPVPDVPGASQGQVLWEEFIQIHRRRVPELAE
jgi:hypothetical protein